MQIQRENYRMNIMGKNVKIIGKEVIGNSLGRILKNSNLEYQNSDYLEYNIKSKKTDILAKLTAYIKNQVVPSSEDYEMAALIQNDIRTALIIHNL